MVPWIFSFLDFLDFVWTSEHSLFFTEWDTWQQWPSFCLVISPDVSCHFMSFSPSLSLSLVILSWRLCCLVLLSQLSSTVHLAPSCHPHPFFPGILGVFVLLSRPPPFHVFVALLSSLVFDVVLITSSLSSCPPPLYLVLLSSCLIVFTAPVSSLHLISFFLIFFSSRLMSSSLFLFLRYLLLSYQPSHVVILPITLSYLLSHAVLLSFPCFHPYPLVLLLSLLSIYLCTIPSFLSFSLSEVFLQFLCKWCVCATEIQGCAQSPAEPRPQQNTY